MEVSILADCTWLIFSGGIIMFKNKRILKFISVLEMMLSIALSYSAGLNSADSGSMVFVSILFGTSALISLDICD